MGVEGEIRERRRRRRAAERRRRTQARRRNAGILAVAIAVVAVTAALLGGSGPSPAPKAGGDVPAPTSSAESTTTKGAEGGCPRQGVSTSGGTPERDRRPVPILMYHEVGDPPEGAGLPDLFVSADDFAAQIGWLKEQGYQAITLDQLDAGWSADGPPLPKRPVVISFDDGLLGQYTNALPTLSAAAWPGVLNLKVESLRQGELTDEMVCEMLIADWELSSHTITHADVTTLTGSDLRREISGSRNALRRRFGVPVHHFAYPAGRLNAEAIAAVREAGYRDALGTEPGIAEPRTRF